MHTQTHLCSQVLQNSGGINGCCRTNTSMTRSAILQVSMNPPYGKLKHNEQVNLTHLIESNENSGDAPQTKKNLPIGSKFAAPAILTLTCKPALAERETAFAFALPESLPALPPA